MNGSTASAPTRPGIIDRMSALADPIRCRLLLALEENELTVGELCSVLQAPQSTVSRHLKVLADDAWVTGRKEGTSRRYAARLEAGDEARRELWRLVRDDVATGAAAREDRRRLEEVVRRRRSRSQEFFSATAGEWADLRRELFGRRFDLHALLGLLDPAWVVGDLGAGTGLTARALAPFVARVVAVDESPAMLDAARQRLAGFDNVETRLGRLEELPLDDETLDAAVLFLVLHHLERPRAALAHALRCLKPGGRLLLVDMLPHEREEYRQEMGHLWLGFAREQIEEWLREAGGAEPQVVALPPDPEAKGPGLFAASASKAPQTPPRDDR
ncbi:MAG: metalloregulator ArsR/SmtB family transcription factor [Thermoanaerobaculia bacterium]|nr:metalloregulator ArsR/SmtB family transcription factor [Thermoanaerobaculia bacterium]